MEAMQYELVRNMTLLFFFERLLDKGEPRTLHDLSCQFGAKGFTKEMRQIAGGSQSGKYSINHPKGYILSVEYIYYRVEEISGSISIIISNKRRLRICKRVPTSSRQHRRR